MRHRFLAGWRLLTRPTGSPPQPTLRNVLFDVALALVLVVAAVLYALGGSGDQDGPALVVVDGVARHVPAFEDDQDERTQAAVTACVTAVALVFRRRYPLTVLWAVLLTTILVASNEPRLTFYACVIAAYTAAAYSQYRIPALVSAAATAAVLAADSNSGIPIVPVEYVPLLVVVPIVVAADGLRRWKLRADERRAELAELERRQAEALRRAAEEERGRIARELHDVVTHNVSVMVIQAGAARKVMQTAPDQAGEALLAVESGGRAAMAELRQAMGLLTADGHSRGDDDVADLQPQPGMSSLPTLVARVRDAGLDVDLTIAGNQRPLPPGIGLAAYRVVQEALTNTVKHAVGASASVTVDYGDRELHVEVVDTGGTAGESASSGNGRGLIGLRERLAVYGGVVDAARRPTGGYRVTASIPLEEP